MSATLAYVVLGLLACFWVAVIAAIVVGEVEQYQWRVFMRRLRERR